MERCGLRTKKESEIKCRNLQWWGKKDSNLRSHEAADLQSAPFATRDTPPLNSIDSPPAEMAATRTSDDVKTQAPDHRFPVGRVYGGSRRAKSTNAISQLACFCQLNCHNPEPVTQAHRMSPAR